MKELVSVIVPVYNIERYLARCIDSILNQTYGELEVILVDDGSKDNSGKICDEYAKRDARVKVIHKENEGQAIARNKALDIMAGSWVVFVDSDDYLRTDAIEVMLLSAKEAGADISLCYAAFDNGDRISETNHPYPDKTVFDGPSALLFEYFSPGNIQSAPWGKLFVKELFDDIRFPPYRAREDYAIMHRLFGKSKRSVHTAKTLYVQYVRPGSTEYSPFNLNKLKVIECDRDIKYYVKEKFPELYEGVRITYACALVKCMEEIAFSFRKRKFRKTFAELRGLLGDELCELRKEGIEEERIAAHSFAYKHPLLLSHKQRLNGLKFRIKSGVKKILFGRKTR